jgi:hypothetical protein
LQWDHVVVAGHNGNCTEFRALGQVDRADPDAAHGSFDLVGQLGGNGNGDRDGASGTFQLALLRTATPISSGRHAFGATCRRAILGPQPLLDFGISEGLDGFDAVYAEIGDRGYKRWQWRCRCIRGFQKGALCDKRRKQRRAATYYM